MIKKYFIAVLIFYVCLFGYGQKNFLPGYVLKSDNDTLFGFIDLKTSNKNSKSCSYAETIDQESVVFLPNEINGYRIEGSKYYVSKEIKIKSDTKSVFLEYLIDGIVDLYYYREELKDYYFLEKEDKLYELSIEEVVILDESGHPWIKEYNRYTGALMYVFQDSPETAQQINTTDFNFKDLISITKTYHNSVCEGEACVNYTKTKKSLMALEAHAGLITSKMYFDATSSTLSQIMPIASINF